MIDYANVGAVCSDCAKSAGFTPKRKVAGVWLDKCGICRKTKPCTDLHHDWRRKKKGRGVSAKRNNCMFALPHELTGMGTTCGLFKGQLACNGYGRKCTGYQPHNAESRKALAEAIAEKQKQKQKEADDGKVV